MEVTAITKALEWVQTTQHTHALVVTDSMSTLEKIRGGSLHSDWRDPIRNSKLKKLTWLFCPGHAGVLGNERADQLAGSAPITGTLTLDPATVIDNVKESLKEARQIEEEESYTLTLVQNKGIQRGDGRKSELRGASRRYSNQLATETVSRHTLRWQLQLRAEQMWTCPECYDANSGTR